MKFSEIPNEFIKKALTAGQIYRVEKEYDIYKEYENRIKFEKSMKVFRDLSNKYDLSMIQIMRICYKR